MNALSIANYIVNNWSDKIEITNLKLNKLVYYSYVESLRKLGRPLFDDAIEAWQYGPVEPAVYQAFSSYGRNPIQATSGPAELDAASKQIVHCVKGYPVEHDAGHGPVSIPPKKTTPLPLKQFLLRQTELTIASLSLLAKLSNRPSLPCPMH